MKPIILGLAMVAWAAACVWAYRYGLQRADERNATVIQRLTDERNAAWATLQNLNESAARQEKEAATRQAEANKLITDLDKKRQQVEAQVGAWHRQFEQVAKSKDCEAVLEQTICPVVFRD